MIRLKKEQFFVLGLLCLITIFISIIFISTHKRSLKSIQSQFISQKALLEQREQKRRDLSRLEEANQKLEDELKSISHLFLKKEEVTAFLNSLSHIALETGNKLKTVRLLERRQESGTNIKKKSVKLNLAGEFCTLRELLDRFKNHERLLKIDELDIRETKNTPMLKASFVLTFYIIAE